MATVQCGFDSSGVAGIFLLQFSGPTLIVDIGFDANFKPGVVGPAPVPLKKGVMALVDTGATESCIDSGLAMQLNLPIVNRRPIAGVHGAKEVNVHMAQIHVPALNYTIYGMFCAVDLIAGGQFHYALLGRTFLSQFKMNYDGPSGSVIISHT